MAVLMTGNEDNSDNGNKRMKVRNMLPVILQMMLMASDRSNFYQCYLMYLIFMYNFHFVNVELLASLVIWFCFTKWLIEVVCITRGIADIECLIIHPFTGNLLFSFNDEVMQDNACINNFQNIRLILFLS